MHDKDGELAWFWDKLNAHLEKSQLKQTQQRKAIVEYFLQHGKHVDAEQLYVKMRHDGLHVGLATIYRTLNLLTEAGLLEQKSFADGKSQFEIQDPDNHHDHLMCLDCGRVLEFENEEIEIMKLKLARDLGFKLERHTLDLFGRCQVKPKCAYFNVAKIPV